MTVFHHLPLALVPFAFCMFVLVQALVTKGWVPVFAYGWDHWVEKTGTVGAIGGMGFVSVILCNVSFPPFPSTEKNISREINENKDGRMLTWRDGNRANEKIVRRHKHRYHYPDLACHPSVGGDSSTE